MKQTQQAAKCQHFLSLSAGHLSIMLRWSLCFSVVWSISLQIRFYNCFARSWGIKEAETTLISNSRIDALKGAPCLGFLQKRTKQAPHKSSRPQRGGADFKPNILLYLNFQQEEASKGHKCSLIKSGHLFCTSAPAWRQNDSVNTRGSLKTNPRSGEGWAMHFRERLPFFGLWIPLKFQQISVFSLPAACPSPLSQHWPFLLEAERTRPK